MSVLQRIVSICTKECRKFSSFDEFQKHLKNELHTPIFMELHTKYLAFFQTWYASYRIPEYSKSSNVIFIYETRNHYNLEFLFYNVMYFARGWGLHVVCSETNYDLIKGILGANISNVRIDIVEDTGEYGDGLVQYNEYMKTEEFWFSIPDTVRKILTVEVDSYMRYPIVPVMLDIDYCASRWGWDADSPGGGGITLRSVSAMKDICRRLPELRKEIFAQDCWASEGICRLGYSYNSTFFMEGCLQKEAVGVHQWWSFSYPMFQERLECFKEYMKLHIDT